MYMYVHHVFKKMYIIHIYMSHMYYIYLLLFPVAEQRSREANRKYSLWLLLYLKFPCFNSFWLVLITLQQFFYRGLC